MLRILCGNERMNSGESSRIYPARQMRSTFFSRSALTISASCCSRVLPFEGITRASRPRFFAAAIPGASSLFEITIAISALGIRPESIDSAIARKLDPRPERGMPSLLFLFTTEALSTRRKAIRSESKTQVSRNALRFAQDDKSIEPTTKDPKPTALLVTDHAVAFDDAADGVSLFADAVEQRHDFFELFRRNHQHHADAHVEGAH